MSISRLRLRLLLVGVLAALAIAGTVVAVAGQGTERTTFRPAASGEPLVIAHRGASGYRPEHTLAAYELGARMGADYVEPDLVSTKDGVLVARHENEISATTDVANRPEFAARRTTKVVDGLTLTGWFTEDFTLRELRTLRAKERIPGLRQRNTIYDGRYRIPTFTEIIKLTRRLSRELRREIGIYPETKHPGYFRSLGLPLERPLVRTLRRFGLDRRRSKVFVQSFETRNLRALNRTVKTRLVQLLGGPGLRPDDTTGSGQGPTYAELATRAGLERVARYADGVGPSTDYIVPRDASGNSLPPTSFVSDAHAAGLVVHPYTFRNENAFLPLELRSGPDPAAYGNALAQYEQFYALGVDGVFSDNPDTAAEARSSR
ncbi:MAG TPA: glycerophosphodiester phosphodiesterase [Thermoleophilaceae bacterium]|nr:glycerophosphodiester phosphodiesterase [Thermoleophilaceae bacterium]